MAFPFAIAEDNLKAEECRSAHPDRQCDEASGEKPLGQAMAEACKQSDEEQRRDIRR